jgi:hypothetical protein
MITGDNRASASYLDQQLHPTALILNDIRYHYISVGSKLFCCTPPATITVVVGITIVSE